MTKNKKRIKIVKFLGGLGNQMFQYAFGKALEHETGADILFDITSFEKAKKKMVGNTGRTKKGVSVRQYEINIFKNIDVKLTSSFTSIFLKILM